MGSEWSMLRLGDVCSKIGSGATPRGGKSSYLDAGPFSLVRSQNVLNNSFSWGGLAFISAEQAAALKGVALEEGDVLLNITGDSVARCCRLDPAVLPGRVNQHVAIIRTDPSQLDSRFLSYWLVSPATQAHLLSLAGAGATRNALTKAMIENLRVSAPSLDEQRAIASILGALDDKIELNRKMSRTLDEMAQAIFKSWFVDFDGREIDSSTKAPIGWPVEAIGNHVEVSRGLSYSGKYLADPGEGLPLHNLNSVYEGGGYKFSGMKWYSGDYKDRHVCRPGDLLVTNTEQGFEFLLIGFPGVVPRSFGDRGLFSHHMYKVDPREGSPLDRVFLYWLLRDTRFHRQVAGFTNGTTVNMLPMDGLSMPRLAIPPRSMVDAFISVASPMLAKQDVLYEERLSLGALRDALLPRLLSGELRVQDAESIVEEVV